MSIRSNSRWYGYLLVLLLITSLMMAGCGSSEPEEAEEEAPPLLPRITVQVDEQGVPSVLGISVDSVGNLLGQDFSAYYLPEDLVQQLQDAGVQHLELVVAGDGIYLFSNGEPLPYLALDDEARGNLGQVAEIFGLPSPGAIQWASDNILSRVGVPIVLKLPIGEGASEVPLRDVGTLARVQIDDARADVGDNSLVFYADVQLDANGQPTIGGVSVSDIEEGLNQAGMTMDLSAVAVDPALVASLQAADVQHVQVETEPEGVYLYLNGQALPRVAWDTERLENAADLYQSIDPNSPYLPLLKLLLPSIQPADVELTVLLPKQPDAEEQPRRPFLRRK